jgi:broad specificity phosphatase PhoE
MLTQIVFETHSWSEDNERGVASGWRDPPLSPRGRMAARALGARRRNDGIVALFSSDLRRAMETAHIACEGASIPLFCDWRLRECNYGDWNGAPVTQLHPSRRHYLDISYPGGESWRAAVQRVGRALDDIARYWPDERVLVIGHVATRWSCEHLLNNIPLESLVDEEFIWQEGWEYEVVR